MLTRPRTFLPSPSGQSAGAKRAGINEIIICHENRRNIEAIPEMYIKGLTFHYVKDIKEVIDIALLKEKVKNPINLTA